MISVVISARNAARPLAATLMPLIPPAVDGVVRQVIVVDGRSSDSTAKVADDAGADIVESAGGRGAHSFSVSAVNMPVRLRGGRQGATWPPAPRPGALPLGTPKRCDRHCRRSGVDASGQT